MKRSSSSSSGNDNDNDKDLDDDIKLKKKLKQDDPQEQEEEATLSLPQLEFDDNLLYEVLRHTDPITLARSACVNKQWLKTAHDERLWEFICTKQGSTVGCAVVHHRSVVTALGGFRRLFNLYIWPLIKPSSAPAPPPPVAEESSYEWAPVRIDTNGSSSSSSSSSSSNNNNNTNSSALTNKRWGKEEVNLSLSLLSIRYFENMNFKNKGK